ncbi:MAG TPA: PQQ-binding-like beta-propeller repeat protein [Thermoanaerobaculia bacterium]
MRIPAVLILVFSLATAGSAQMMGGRPAGMRGIGDVSSMMMSGDGMALPVASDGTVFVNRTSASNGTEIVAVRASGAEGWHHALGGNSMMIMGALTPTTLVLSSFGTTGMFPALTVKSQLIALSIASGNPQWTLDVDGVAMGVTSSNDGGVYAIVVSATSGPITRKLVSVGADGRVRWSMPLN